MVVSFADFWAKATSNPSLMIISLLTMGVILVNGWTDAPNAIATAISTRSIRPRTAVLMAAVLNFLGVLVMTLVSTAVMDTISGMVNFGDDDRTALIALAAALVAIVVWATAAWWFGIPTSESHALIAGLSGAAIAATGGMEGINMTEWKKVIFGLFFSTILGFILGFFIVRLVEFFFRDVDRRKTTGFFRGAQIFGAGAMAFMHGAQDGQKFMSVFLLGISLTSGLALESMAVPIWLMLLCSIVMGLGTSFGGERIIKTVGMDMVKLEKHQGFSADVAAAISLLASQLTGIPVSTTHTKTTAIMGVGASKRLSSVNWSVVKEMVLAWVLTFPGCGIIGYFMAKLFMHIF